MKYGTCNQVSTKTNEHNINLHRFKFGLVGFMVFSTTFNNMSVISISFIGGGNQRTPRKPPTGRKLLTNFITKCCTPPWSRFELTTSVVIDTVGNRNSNYYKITATTVPHRFKITVCCEL